VQLLIDRLDLNATNTAMLNRLSNGKRVVVIVLLATQVGFDMLCWQQLHTMTQRAYLPGPVVRAGASLHANDSPRLIGQKCQHLMAVELLAPRWVARAVKGGNEEDVLCQVDANCHRLVHGLLLSPFGSSRCIASISWRIDAVEGRGRRPSHRAPARPLRYRQVRPSS